MAGSKISNWWLVRHAPVLQKTLYGQLDVAADYSDDAAFLWLASELPRDARWITSDLSRCQKTARKILSGGATPTLAPEICPALREQNFGNWQGLSYSQIEEIDPVVYARFWQDPAKNCPPGGESFEGLMQRVNCLPAEFSKSGHFKDTVIVAHAGSIRALTALALDLSSSAALRLDVAPLSLSKLTLYEMEDEQHWHVSWLNRVVSR